MNERCLCRSLDRQKLFEDLKSSSVVRSYLNVHPETFDALFSSVTVFIESQTVSLLEQIISLIERALAQDYFRKEVQAYSPPISYHDFGPRGAFCAYDFHIQDGQPKLIEINTNAGGLLLNHSLSQAQTECCGTLWTNEELEAEILSMIRAEWKNQRGGSELKTIAIVDEKPHDQFLHIEFLLFQKLFQKNGFRTFICSPADLALEGEFLFLKKQKIDLVYNRLTDFYFEEAASRSLREAYSSSSVVVTPNPHNHAFYANKRHLTLLSDSKFLSQLNMTSSELAFIKDHVPCTVLVTEGNAEELWKGRKNLFFKPLSGFGSKATYRGDKLTSRVWKDICASSYVAQEFVSPSVRLVGSEEKNSSMKFDLRAYTYCGEIQYLAGRIYSGQTTNFRTPGGGFASVAIL